MKKVFSFPAVFLAILPAAIIPDLSFAQTPPQIIVTFGAGANAIPLEQVPLLAILGIVLIVLIAGYMGKLRGKLHGTGLFMSVAASLVLAGAALFGIDAVRAQMAQRTLELTSSPAVLQILESQNDDVLVRNKTGQTITLRSVSIGNDSAGEYSVASSGTTCTSGLQLDNEQTCEVRVTYTAGGSGGGDTGDNGDTGDSGDSDFINNPQTPDDFIQRVQALANGDPRIPQSTPEELQETFKADQNTEVIARQNRLRQNHEQVLSAIDPDPTWHKTEANHNFIVAEPGNNYTVDLSKVDPDGNNLGALTKTDQARLRFEARVQENETTVNYVPSHSHKDYIHWDETTLGRLHINVPADMKQGRLLIGIRPKFKDKGQAAIAERWSVPVVLEIWPKRTGVTSISLNSIYYPTEFNEGIQPRSGSAFTMAEITSHLEQAYADFPNELVLKPLVVSGTNLTINQLIDVRIPRPEGGLYPYGGRVVRIVNGTNGQQLAILNFDLASVYELLESDPLVSEGVMPEFVTFRQGPAQQVPTEQGEPELEFFGPEDRSGIKQNDDKQSNTEISPNKKVLIDDKADFSCDGIGTVPSLVFTPMLEMSPKIDAGVEYTVSVNKTNSSIKVECSVTLDGSVDIVAALARTLPIMRFAALIGIKFDAGPYGEIKVGLGAPPKANITPSVFFKAAGRVTFAEGLSSPEFSFSNNSAAGSGLDDTPWGLEATLGGGAGFGFDLRLEPLSSIFGETFRAVGLEGKAGLNVGVVIDNYNAAAVKQWDESSSAYFDMSPEASLTVSSGFIDLLGFLGLRAETSVGIVFKSTNAGIKSAYVVSGVYDSGRGDGSVSFNRLSLPTLLKAVFTGNTAGYASLEGSSVYNDPTDNVIYDLEECVSKGGTISTPLIACTGGSFCGNADRNADFCNLDAWVTSVFAEAYVDEIASTEGSVGTEGSGTIQVDVSGAPLKPLPVSFAISTLGSLEFTASAFCEERGITRGTIQAVIGGKVIDEKLNTQVCKCSPGSKDCDRTWASPHMITADGLAYDYVASGDYVLARVHDADEQPMHGFEVQSRFLPGYDVSWPQAVAMQVGDDVLEVRAVPYAPSDLSFYGESNALELYLNGRLLAQLDNGQKQNSDFWAGLRNSRVLHLPSGGMIYFDDFAGRVQGSYWTPRAITVLWPHSGAFPKYAVKLSTPYFKEGERKDALSLLEIQIIRPDDVRYSARGMLGNNDGNPNNDFVRRNGQVLAQDSVLSWTALYGLFGGDWLVKPQECLFVGGCITEPVFPREAVVLTDEQRTLGEIACAALIGYYREACIHDVGLSGSAELVESYYANTEDLNAIAERLVTPGVDVPVYLLSAGEKTDLPGYDGKGFRQPYQITHQSGEGRFLLTIRPPRGASAFFSEGGVGALKQSLTATGNLDISVDIQCDNPDPNWMQLGAAWMLNGTVQLWSVDPLSGFASQLLSEKLLSCVFLTGSNNKIATGREHSLFLDDEGRVWAWGYNYYGQLGDGSQTNRLSPVPIDLAPLNGDTVVGVWAGEDYSLALDDQNRLWAWGRNNYGQLGDGSKTDQLRLVQVNLVALNGNKVVAVSAGQSHSLVLDDQGCLWAWGDNRFGQLGDGGRTDRTRPTPVNLALLGDSKVVSVQAGPVHSLVLDDQGRLWAWGGNGNDLFGDGGYVADQLRPGPVDLAPLGGNKIMAAQVGSFHSLALDDRSRLWAWGENNYGQLGNGSTNRAGLVQVDLVPLNGNKVVAVSAGYLHSLALDDWGYLWAWGNNSSGQLGNGSGSTGEYRTRPIQVDLAPLGGSKIVAAQVGSVHSLALDEQGRLWSWGANWDGQLGDGSTTSRSRPIQVDMRPMKDSSENESLFQKVKQFLFK